ncbi:MAG: ABC transporter substrate-binding protein [Lautropia sp.]
MTDRTANKAPGGRSIASLFTTTLFGCALVASSTALAADPVKIGFVSTLSGPSAALGTDILDGFKLALKLAGDKAGGRPIELLVNDDQFKPDVGKQAFEKLIKRDRVDFMTGVVFSNILLAGLPEAVRAKTFYISPNAAPSPLAGEKCTPWFFGTAWPNDALHEAAGQYASSKGFKNVFLMAPNYQAGKDSLSGFKRTFTGTIQNEVYTKLGQLDYATEIASIRAAKPDALYTFLPGGMGINFIKQFVGAGLSKDTQLITPGFGSDQDVIRPVGDAMAGIFDTSHWAINFDNEANKTFVAAFEKDYSRLPSIYAAQGYDAAQMIIAAVRDMKGNLKDKEALRQALNKANFKSVRGEMKFNKNQMVMQNYYLRVITKDAQGRLMNKQLGEPIMKMHGDAYVQNCQMKPAK